MPRKPRPKWLDEKITASRRGAVPETCPRCGADVLVGPSDDVLAVRAVVDVAPVEAPVDEAAHLVAGRQTYDLVVRAGERRLYVRENYHQRAPRKHLVLADHVHRDAAPSPVNATATEQESLW